MAVAALLEFPGVTREQYESVIADLDLGGKPAPGNSFHAAGPMAGGWWALDVWDSPERMGEYFSQELGAVLQRHGLPNVQPRLLEVSNLLK